ncbi:TPA: hypothetical protein ACPVYK_001100 [Vibrio parahaemolyticus]
MDTKQVKLDMAAREYFLRLRGKRTPSGKWVNGMYFLPCAKREREKCCAAYDLEVEHDSKALWEHCQSIEHIANRHQVKPTELKETINKTLKKGK